jgi:dihydroorotase
MSAGIVDLDVSWRSPPAPDDESAAALVDAAVAGGVSVAAVAVIDSGSDVGRARAACAALQAAARGRGLTIVPAFSPVGTDGDLADLHALAEMLVEMGSGSAAAPGRPVWRLQQPTDDAVLLRRLGDLARAHDAVVMVPAVDAGLAKDAIAFESPTATRLGLKAMPEAAETIGIARVIEIARLTGGRFHVVGVATAAGAAMLEGSGLDTVTGSVQAVHLLLDESAWVRHPFDGRLLQRPPLPTASSRAALVDAVKRGALFVSSGHRAVPKRKRDLELGKAAAGGTALSSAPRLLRTLLGDDIAIQAFSRGPGLLLGLPAGDLDTATVIGDDDLARHVKEFAP